MNSPIQNPDAPASATGETSLQSEFGNRLIQLSNGHTGLRGTLPARVREISDTGGKAIVEFIASDSTLDRYEEIIDANGWKLSAYRKNPVFQNAHQYGDVIFTLGKALITEVRQYEGRPVLYQQIEFATEVNPMARLAYGLYRGGFLNAVSVGFIPLRWENGGQDAPFRRRYLEQELIEVSAVSIPANPNALQLGLAAGTLERADLSAVLDMLLHAGKEFVRGAIAQPSNGHTTGNPQNFGSVKTLLQLARDISELMKRLN